MCSSTVEDYIKLQKSIKETWFTKNNEDIEIIFYIDDENIKEATFDENLNILTLPCKDGYYTCAEKTYLAFDWLNKNYDFDFLYRSNLGSYVIIDKMIKFLENKSKYNFYSGIIGEDYYYYNRSVKFISGSGYFLSKNLVKLSVENKNLWDFNIVDDVNLGNLFSMLNIPMNQDAIRLNLCDDEFYFQEGDCSNKNSIQLNKDYLIEFLYEESDVYHIRLRSVDRNLDIQRMHEIHSLVMQKLLKLHYGGSDIVVTRNDVLEPLKHYQLMCKIQSDINEHLPILKKYAEECTSVTEMGVRFACSTWALIEAKPSKLRCYDINYKFFKPSEKVINEMCNKYNIDFEFINGDSLENDIEQTDMLFIDTLHTYNQLSGELHKHQNKVNKWIILHDVITFGRQDEGIYEHASILIKNKENTKIGIMTAIEDFILVNKNWKIEEIYHNNNGLAILKRIIN